MTIVGEIRIKNVKYVYPDQFVKDVTDKVQALVDRFEFLSKEHDPKFKVVRCEVNPRDVLQDGEDGAAVKFTVYFKGRKPKISLPLDPSSEELEIIYFTDQETNYAGR